MKKILFLLIALTLSSCLAQNPTRTYHAGGILVAQYSADPSGVRAGQIYWNTTTEVYRVYDGTSWNDFAPAAGATNLIGLSDVNSSTPTNKFVLIADGVDFESRALIEDDISDLLHFTPTNLLTDYSFTDNSSNWNTAFSWGDHSLAGYLSSEVDGSVTNEIQDIFEIDASGYSPTNYTAVGGTDLDNHILGIDTELQTIKNDITTNEGDIADNTVEAKTDVIIVSISDLATDIETGSSKGYFHAPYAFTLNDVEVGLLDAGTVSGITVDINEDGVSVLSTLLTTDATEDHSSTAATAAVISDSSIALNALITIDIDSTGTGLKGGLVYLHITRN